MFAPLNVLGFRVPISNNAVHPTSEGTAEVEEEDNPEEEEDDDDDEEEEEKGLDEMEAKPPNAETSLEKSAGDREATSAHMPLPVGGHTNNKEHSDTDDEVEDEDDEETEAAAANKNRGAPTAKQPPIARELSVLVSVCVSVKFHGFESALKSTCS